MSEFIAIARFMGCKQSVGAGEAVNIVWRVRLAYDPHFEIAAGRPMIPSKLHNNNNCTTNRM